MLPQCGYGRCGTGNGKMVHPASSVSLSPLLHFHPTYPHCTGWMEWMSRRKRRETKQQPSMLPDRAVTGCFLFSFCFMCDIHSIHSVVFKIQRPLYIKLSVNMSNRYNQKVGGYRVSSSIMGFVVDISATLACI